MLLKNDNKLLPLDSRKLGKLALIGPHANGSLVFLGGQNYHGVNKLVDQYVG